MNEKDWTRLNQFIGMMGSAHDGEAVNAWRMAEKILKANKLSLTDLLHRPEAIQDYDNSFTVRAAEEAFKQRFEEEMRRAADVRRAEQERQRDQVREAIRDAFNTLERDGTLSGFFRGLKTYFETHGWLSTKQMRCLFEEVDVVTDRRRRGSRGPL